MCRNKAYIYIRYNSQSWSALSSHWSLFLVRHLNVFIVYVRFTINLLLTLVRSSFQIYAIKLIERIQRSSTKRLWWFSRFTVSPSLVLRAPGTSLYHRHHRHITYVGPRGPGLSNPASFMKPAILMAPTTDDNARDKRSVLGLNPATF